MLHARSGWLPYRGRTNDYDHGSAGLVRIGRCKIWFPPLRCGFPRVLATTRLLGPPPRHLIAPFRELRHHLKGMVGRSRNAQLGAFPHDVTVEKVDLLGLPRARSCAVDDIWVGMVAGIFSICSSRSSGID